MKIGEAAKRTGLSEKAIRLYTENGLVHPQVTPGLHRDSYEFTEENIRELEQVGIFRRAGFSIFEIVTIREEPEKLPALVESKRATLEVEAELRKNVQAALGRLQASETGDIQRVEAALRPAVEDRKPVSDGVSRRVWVALGTIAVGTLLFLWLRWFSFRPGSYIREAVPMAIMLGVVGFLAGLLGCLSLAMAWRYLRCPHRAAKLPHQAVGTVTCVMEEIGFDGRYARAGAGGAGTREPGIGGIWQIFFLLWGAFRFDCWFPVIRYTDEKGKERSSTFVYGGFRNTWRKGDEVRFAWNDKHPQELLPLEGTWLKRKALHYSLLGLALLVIAAVLCAQLGSLSF